MGCVRLEYLIVMPMNDVGQKFSRFLLCILMEIDLFCSEMIQCDKILSNEGIDFMMGTPA